MVYIEVENPVIAYEPEEMPDIECPECGMICYTLYKRDFEIVGCENCIKEVDAYEELLGE